MSSDDNLKEVAPEVYFALEGVNFADAPLVDFLKTKASRLPRRRCRICFHETPSAPTHEMLIVHHRSCYVRPHRHIGNAESLTVIEGLADLVLFSEQGSVASVHSMGAPGGTSPHYCRMPDNTWHSLIIKSEWLVFFEVVKGPFNPSSSEFATWAPDESDATIVAEYMQNTRADIDQLRKTEVI